MCDLPVFNNLSMPCPEEASTSKELKNSSHATLDASGNTQPDNQPSSQHASANTVTSSKGSATPAQVHAHFHDHDTCHHVCVTQELWPDHCVQSTHEASIHPRLLQHLGISLAQQEQWGPDHPLGPKPIRPPSPSLTPNGLPASAVLSWHTVTFPGGSSGPALLVQKGRAPHLDVYSAFFDNGGLAYS